MPQAAQRPLITGDMQIADLMGHHEDRRKQGVQAQTDGKRREQFLRAERTGQRTRGPIHADPGHGLRLLQDGSKARARGFGKQSYIENDESSNQLSEFYDKLFDHGALWKLENGRVICTAMPYSDEKIVLDEFERLKNKYEYPDNVILNFLDEKYKFRKNGDIMVIISFDEI